jgi:hypothetical protein
VPPGADERDLAEGAGVEIPGLGLDVVGAGALLEADLADAVVDAGGFNDDGPLFDAQGEGRFRVDVLAGGAQESAARVLLGGHVENYTERKSSGAALI